MIIYVLFHHIVIIIESYIFHIFSSLYDHLTLRMPFLGNTLMRAFTLPSPPLAMRRTREFRLGHKCTGLQLLLGLWPLSFWIFRIWSLSRCLKLRSRTGKCRYTHSSPPERIDYLMYRAQSHLNVKVYIVLPYIITISTSESLNIFGWTLSKYS